MVKLLVNGKEVEAKKQLNKVIKQNNGEPWENDCTCIGRKIAKMSNEDGNVGCGILNESLENSDIRPRWIQC